MEVYLNRIDGIDDAIISMYLSKRTLTPELEEKIRTDTWLCSLYGTPCNGAISEELLTEAYKKDYLDKLFKWGKQHITMLRFIDLSFTVYGLHRGAQDDFDAHSMRLNNRIVRSSTRLASFDKDEMSDYYKDKIITTDMAANIIGIDMPEEIIHDGVTYVRGVNGYIVKGMEGNNDVKRGLYMLSIPSNFIFRCNLTEFAHIYKERRKEGTANPELKEAIEMMVDQLEYASCGYINRELLMEIKN